MKLTMENPNTIVIRQMIEDNSILLNPNKKSKICSNIKLKKKYDVDIIPFPLKVDSLKTGLVYDSRTEKHQPFSNREGMLAHVENPMRTINIIARLKDKNIIDDDIEFIEEVDFLNRDKANKVHGEHYVEILESFWPEGLDRPQMKFKDTYYNANSFEAALRSAESVRLSVENVLKGHWKNAFALSRPPGHHAQKDNRMHGFCFLNNVVIGAREAIDQYGVKKVLILDWDVHHGDSTQKLVYEDGNILYISIHRFDGGKFFPGPTGDLKNTGAKEGEGFNLNFPIDVDEKKEEFIDDSYYTYIFERLIFPVVQQFNPELILISCGLDCLFGDPLGRIHLNGDCKLPSVIIFTKKDT